MDNTSKKRIDLVIAELNKKYGAGTISRLKDFANLNLPSLSSGIHFLDWSISGIGKGFPRGGIVELYGLPSSGKSLISAITVAQTQRKGGDCVWIDCENAFDPEFASKLGVDINKIIISQSSIGEPTLDLICKLLEAQPDLVVIDSVASMVPLADMEKPFDEPVMATRARLMSRGLAKITALNKRTLIIFINQLRSNIGMYGAPSVTTGGRALGHYTSVRLEIKTGDFIEENKQRIGQIVKFRVTKNKVGPPWKEGFFEFYYDGRIEQMSGLIALAIMQGKVVPAGAWFEYGGKKVQGKDGLAELLKTDVKLFEQLLKDLS